MSDLLSLSGIGVPPYSARGATQTLEPIDQSSQTRRTINGSLVDLSRSEFRKYKSTISCSDQQPPAVDGVWPGQEVTVDCIAELCFLTSSAGPQRTAVTGSERVDGSFTFYRPRLTMRVISFSQNTDDYGAVVSWSMQLEEV
jgi:hypothetical protein